MIVWLNLRKWSCAAGSIFHWERYYLKGYQWTPIIIGRLRREQFDMHDLI